MRSGMKPPKAMAVECSQIRNSVGYALALARGSKIGAGRKVCRTAGLESVFGTYQLGNWKNSKNRYLGLKFEIKGKTHFGWARLSVGFKNGIRAILTGYAYETIPNKPIKAGQTHGENDATLGRLAQGASGVSRQKK